MKFKNVQLIPVVSGQEQVSRPPPKNRAKAPHRNFIDDPNDEG
jgi:hypothetical protein